MQKLTMRIVAISAVTAAFSARADVPVEKVEDALRAGSDYGIQSYKEFDFDDNGKMEIEGWLDEEWFVEIDVSSQGEVLKEKRQRRIEGAWGMTEARVREVVEAAKTDGMTIIEEINLKPDGIIEVEGEDSLGREIELKLNI